LATFRIKNYNQSSNKGCGSVVLVRHSFSALFDGLIKSDCSPHVASRVFTESQGPQAGISNTSYYQQRVVYTRIRLTTDFTDPLETDSSDTFCVNNSFPLFFSKKHLVLHMQFSIHIAYTCKMPSRVLCREEYDAYIMLENSPKKIRALIG